MRALLVGRFQPPHRGHVRAIQAAQRKYGRVLVGVGSAQHAHEPTNPFTVGERFDLLTAALAAEGVHRVHLYPLPDLHRHASWVRHVEALLPPFDVVVTNNPLTARLFRAAGYRIEPGPVWRREAWRGREVRAAWSHGADAGDALPRAVARLVERMDGPARVRALLGGDRRGRRGPP